MFTLATCEIAMTYQNLKGMFEDKAGRLHQICLAVQWDNETTGNIVFFFNTKPKLMEVLHLEGRVYRLIGEAKRSTDIRQVKRFWRWRIELLQ